MPHKYIIIYNVFCKRKKGKKTINVTTPDK